MNSYKTGLFSEYIARIFLIMHGFRILSKRYITGRNTHRAEIDIIAKRGNLIIFVEVKHRKTLHAAWDAISQKQIYRLRLAAETFLTQKRWQGDARFDVIAVHGWHLDWIKNAF
ncbi:MAG: YraN family protein [Alphaproteobacteria bacterium]|nr:YraN family protein [Alphaproteobacteria bacterium]